MKNSRAWLVVLGVSILAVGFTSCEADQTPSVIPKLAPSMHGNTGDSMPGDERSAKESANDSILASKDQDHGGKGDSMPPSDD